MTEIDGKKVIREADPQYEAIEAKLLAFENEMIRKKKIKE